MRIGAYVDGDPLRRPRLAQLATIPLAGLVAASPGSCSASPRCGFRRLPRARRPSGFQPLFAQPVVLEFVAPWLLLFAGLYFVLNTLR